MAYAWIYPKTKEVSIVNAGHEAVFICGSDGCTDIDPTGPVLGMIARHRRAPTLIEL
jgi:serine phosphatase RsbU (regulator of sigma subunit)